MKRCSLYRHFAEDGELLYIGISISAINRLGQHEDHSAWFNSIARVEIEHFDTRAEALEAEREAIQNENPKYNKLHKVKPEIDETRYEAKMAEISREKLLNQTVSFEPFYKIGEAARVLRRSEQAVKKMIQSGEISAVVLSERTRVYKGEERQVFTYGITGWQLIEYLEYLEQEKGTL